MMAFIRSESTGSPSLNRRVVCVFRYRLSGLMENQPVLELRNIRKTFPGVVALDEVSFNLSRREVHVLLGENGAGKSTLMKILSGAYRKDSGEILIDGRRVEITGTRQAQELGISIIYQEFNLIPHLSAAENIFLGREPTVVPGILDRRKLFQDAEQLIKSLGVRLDPRTRVSALSVAEQQIVEIAKALSVDAKILLMDEPTSGLTRSEIERLFGTIGNLREKGVALIYISHRMEELFEIGDRVTILRDGRYIATHPIAQVTAAQLVRLMADREIKEHFPKRKTAPGEELLRVERLNRRHHLRDVSFRLRRGEVVGLAGLLGSGRTALARALFGADPTDSGRVFVKGRERSIKSPADAIRLGIAFLTEDRKRNGLVLTLSVKHNVSLPNTRRLSRFGVMRGGEEKTLAERTVRELRIKTPGIDQKVMFLSGGNQQKVVLGKWLAHEADLVIFDEPTRGIDVGAKQEIYQLMNRLTAAGAGILMISSDLPEILGMSDRILVMHRGRIAGELAAEEATQEKVLSLALGQAP